MADEKRHDEIQGQIIHVYDGIEEADNQLPLWWLITFYGAIAFAVVYYFHYHVFETGEGSFETYAGELAELQSAASAEVSSEALVALSEDAGAVSEGQAVFTTNCVACHGEEAQGTIGPNLTDAYWIHGGDAVAVHGVVSAGVSAAGMPAWGAVLGPDAVEKVTAYILTLRDTNVAGKEAQGDLYGEEAAAEPAAAETETETETEATVH